MTEREVIASKATCIYADLCTEYANYCIDHDPSSKEALELLNKTTEFKELVTKYFKLTWSPISKIFV